MKGIFKILSIGILITALVGAIYLSRKNQETRKGAASAETSSTILPSEVKTTIGQNFNVNVWVNTGSANDKLQGADFWVSYDFKNIEFVSAVAQNGFEILNADLRGEGEGMKVFKMVTLGEEKAGAVDLLKLTFRPLNNNSGTVGVGWGRIMINGQSTTWEIAKYYTGSHVGVGGGPTIFSERCTSDSQCGSGLVCSNGICVTGGKRVAQVGEMCGGIAGIMCATGLDCSYSTKVGQMNVQPDQSGICVKGDVVKVTPTPTTTTGLQCGNRCGVSGTVGCKAGLTCTPIWWPCSTLPPTLFTKLQANVALDANTVAEMMNFCPQVTKVMPTGYVVGTPVTMPAFYGVCRNATCPSAADCNCVGGPSPTPKPTIRLPSPTIAMSSSVEMSGLFEYPSAKVGDEIMAKLVVKGGLNKISAISTSVIFDPAYFKILSVSPMTGSQGVTNSFDEATGTVKLYMFWNSPASSLSTYPEYALVKLQVKKAGVGTVIYNRDYKNEVSGIDKDGKSVGFALQFSNPTATLSVDEVKSCTECTSGLAKGTGNANCDSQVNSLDFEVWRGEVFDKGGLNGVVSSTWMSDFNCDSKVSGLDFEIWRRTVFN